MSLFRVLEAHSKELKFSFLGSERERERESPMVRSVNYNNKVKQYEQRLEYKRGQSRRRGGCLFFLFNVFLTLLFVGICR